ncbi:hypothetical protein KR018_009529, partial [Drosophila ironensis]
MSGRPKVAEPGSPWYTNFYNSFKQTPINVALLVVSAVVFYKVVSLTRRRQRRRRDMRAHGLDPLQAGQQDPADLAPMRCDFTVAELRRFDGTRTDGRILVAINFSVYDVSRSKHYYGPEGIYPNYGGRDISRNLINFSVESNERKEFDDLSDLSLSQMSTLREWDLQYRERYPYVGKLLREGVPHTNYDDEEDDSEDAED